MKPDFRSESLKINYNFGITFAFFALDTIKKKKKLSREGY